MTGYVVVMVTIERHTVWPVSLVDGSHQQPVIVISPNSINYIIVSRSNNKAHTYGCPDEPCVRCVW